MKSQIIRNVETFFKEKINEHSDPLTRILQTFEEHKGELVITNSNKVERLVAIGTDDYDYYYITSNGREFRWFTCVGDYIILKDKIDLKDYQKLLHIAKLNHYDSLDLYCCKKEDRTKETLKFVKKARKNMSKTTSPDKYLSKICWKFN